MDELNIFLRGQRILQIAPHAGDPWIANVYMGCKTADNIYFVGKPTTLYGKQLIEDPRLAFATAWHSDADNGNRKGIQGVGTAVFTADDNEIEIGVQLHNQNYPEFAERITADWIKTNEKGSGMWVITPTYIKYWDDELYGTDKSKEFKF